MNDIERLDYEYLDKYDRKYSVKGKDVLCLSERRINELCPNGNYRVYGETLLKNKKAPLGEIRLAEENFSISAYGGHSRFLYEQVGFVRVSGGTYVALLKMRKVLLSVLAIILIGLACFALLFTRNVKVEAPSFENETNTKNAIHVYLPQGNIQYEMKDDVSKYQGYRLRLYIKDNGVFQRIHTQKVALDKNNNIENSRMKFKQSKYEFKRTTYRCRMRFRLGNRRKMITARVYVIDSTNASGDAMSKKITRVNLAKGRVRFFYSQAKNKADKAKIQLILKQGKKELLLAESDILYPGKKIRRLPLDKKAAAELEKGKYKGIIRVYTKNGKGKAESDTEFEQTVIVR